MCARSLKGMDVAGVMAEIAAGEDAKTREINERRGDDLGVKLGDLRKIAKTARGAGLEDDLWTTGDVAAQLIAVLGMKPRAVDSDRVDALLREAASPKVHEWFVNYVAKKHPAAEDLRVRWLGDGDPVTESAGWALTQVRIQKSPEGLDLPGILDEIEARMVDADPRLQWEMNNCLAYVGIHHGELRERAVAIGERLGVLKDYPTPPGCTSPYAPLWIAEMVSRQE